MMRAVIIGGGISGVAHALVLGRRGWHVTIVEQATGPREAGYVIDFFGPGVDAAADLGVLDALRAHGRWYEELRMVDSADRTTARLDLTAVFGDGERVFSILRGDVERVLRAALPPGVEQRFGRRPRTIDRTDSRAPRVILDDGSELAADLVIGADGLHSHLRQHVLLPETAAVRHLGYRTGAFTTSELPELADELGWTVVLSDVLGGQVGVYADERRRLSTFVVARADAMRPADPVAWTREAMRGHGRVAELLAEVVPAGPELYCDQVAQSIVPRWRDGRILVTGDAAHAVSLLGGQGVSLAIAGARALDAQLERHGTDVVAALVAHEAAWRPVVTRAQRRARRAAGSFAAASRSQQLLRRAVFTAADLPFVAPLLVRAVGGGRTH